MAHVNEIELEKVMLIYNKGSYIETISVNRDGSYGAAVPLTRDSLKRVSIDVKATPQILNQNIVFYSETRKLVMWKNDGIDVIIKRKDIDNNENAIKFQLKSKLGVLYLVNNDVFRIFMYVQPLSQNSFLYHAPFPNVSENGIICLGTNHGYSGEFSPNDISEYFTNMLWGSVFTHKSHDLVVGGDLNKFFARYAKSGVLGQRGLKKYKTLEKLWKDL